MASFVFNKIAVSLIKQLLITFPLLIFSYRGSNNPTDDRTLKDVYKMLFLLVPPLLRQSLRAEIRKRRI